jgi:hypothetical protein
MGHYLARLGALCGPRLLSVAFYGPFDSHAAGAAGALTNAVIFDAVDLELLSRIAAEGARFGRAGIAAPWALTAALVDDSRDSFPLELIEIQQRHVTIFGPDFFSGLGFEPAHVRLQCERELKVIEIHLQRGLLAAAGDERLLGRVGLHLAQTLLRILRGLLWLGGDRVPRGGFELVAAVEPFVARGLPGVRRALDDSETASWSKFSDLHADVRALRDFADHLP